MLDPYIGRLLEAQNRIFDRQTKALERIADALEAMQVPTRVTATPDLNINMPKEDNHA